MLEGKYIVDIHHCFYLLHVYTNILSSNSFLVISNTIEGDTDLMITKMFESIHYIPVQ